VLKEKKDGVNLLPARTLERTIMKTTVRCLGLINDLGLSSPVRLHISLTGVKGYKLGIETWGQNIDAYFYEQESERHEIDQDDLLLPGLLLISQYPIAQMIKDTQNYLHTSVHCCIHYSISFGMRQDSGNRFILIPKTFGLDKLEMITNAVYKQSAAQQLI
jgi:hypothetical protein